MIDYIIGKTASLSPARLVLDCNGIGYEIGITLIDFDELKNMPEAKMYIHESIREDAHQLFGFLNENAREYFRLLIGVSGVGPNTARLILSSLSCEQLESSISNGNTTALKAVKGIGAKTAERIIVDLKDKIKRAGKTFTTSTVSSEETFNDALAALVMLGFSQQASQKALQKIFLAEPEANAEQAIKMALKML